MRETPVIIGFATVRQSYFDCRTEKPCDSHPETYVIVRSTVAPKSQKNKGLRQCDSSKMTVANQLSQAACDSATVPYYIGTACTDRRTAAPGTGKGKSNRTSTGRQLSIHNGATRAARGIEVPHWFVSAGWL